MEKVFVFITFASLQLEGELQIENFNKFLQILFLIWKNKQIFFCSKALQTVSYLQSWTPKTAYL